MFSSQVAHLLQIGMQICDKYIMIIKKRLNNFWKLELKKGAEVRLLNKHSSNEPLNVCDNHNIL